MPLTVTALAVPVAGAAPDRDVLDLVEVERRHHRVVFGHEDLVHDAASVASGLTRQRRPVTGRGRRREVGGPHTGPGPGRGRPRPSCARGWRTCATG